MEWIFVLRNNCSVGQNTGVHYMNKNDATHKSEINATMAFTQSLSLIVKQKKEKYENITIVKSRQKQGF